MLVTQKVETRWDVKNRERYELRGYVFTKYQDKIIVKVEDLPLKSGAKVEVKCDYCGEIHFKMWKKYLSQREKYPKDACKKCGIIKKSDVMLEKYGVCHYNQTDIGRKNIGDIKRKYTIDQIKILFKKEGYELITDFYINNAQKLEYICPNHGLKTISLGHFLNGKRCNQCQRERISNSTRYNYQDVENLIKSYDSEIEIINIEYKGYNNNSITLKCKECENQFKTRLPFILMGKTRCDHCTKSQSFSEFTTEVFLLKNKYKYDKKKSFAGCKYTNKLAFDFIIYLKNNKFILLELDGQQHYKPVRFNGISKEKSIELFEKNKIRDKLKNEYCKDNNIQLLRIPYWEFDDLEEILHKKLNKYDLFIK